MKPLRREQQWAFSVGTVMVCIGTMLIHPGLTLMVVGAGIVWAFNDEPTQEYPSEASTAVRPPEQVK